MVTLFLVLTLLQMTKDEAEKLAIEALAHRLGVGVDLVELRRTTAVDWPDSSLGCPQEGESYLSVLTPGYLVRLQADGQVYSVHAGGGRAVVCGTGLRPVGGAVVGESVVAEPAIELPESKALRDPVIQARADLAQRSGVSPDAIDLLEIKEVVWPDASLGCPRPGKLYPQVAKEGFLIRLRLEKRVYRYHSGQGGAPFLCESPAPAIR
jgi:hypothetical protein